MLRGHQSRSDDLSDYTFDVPVEVAQSLCGFRHDVDPPGGSDGEAFEVLEREDRPRA